MRTATILLLSFMLLPGVFGYISDNFTQIDDPNIIDFAFGFKNSLGDADIFFWMIGSLGVIAGAAVFTWSKDWVNSALFGSLITLFVGFLAVMIVRNGERLITWDSFSLYVTVAVLLAIYKKVSDK